MALTTIPLKLFARAARSRSSVAPSVTRTGPVPSALYAPVSVVEGAYPSRNVPAPTTSPPDHAALVALGVTGPGLVGVTAPPPESGLDSGNAVIELFTTASGDESTSGALSVCSPAPFDVFTVTDPAPPAAPTAIVSAFVPDTR